MKIEIINKHHEIRRVKSFEAADAFFEVNGSAGYRLISEVAGIKLNCTGTEFVNARKRVSRPGTNDSGKSYKQLLSEVKDLQKSVHDRQAKLAGMVPKSEPVSEPDHMKNFQITYSLTNQ